MRNKNFYCVYKDAKQCNLPPRVEYTNPDTPAIDLLSI
nr:MAG TPA: hypothetical protein [Bacteriophage sp.]